MAKWGSRILRRIHELANAEGVNLTHKAEYEAAVLGLEPDDVTDVVRELELADLEERIQSEIGEWLYIFKPKVARRIVYLKIAVRNTCLVISFHEDERKEG